MNINSTVRTLNKIENQNQLPTYCLIKIFSDLTIINYQILLTSFSEIDVSKMI
jgi:hypothetical protein